MKLSIIATTIFLFVIIIIVDTSEAYVEEVLVLNETNLKLDEPLIDSDYHPKLRLYKATGSIGLKTFSQMHHIRSLEIEESNIDQVEDGALCSPPNLEELIIYRNKQFPMLTLPLLDNCDNVKSLTVGGIQIELNALQSMDRLWNLHLMDQNFSHLTRYSLRLKHLETLEFFRCTIKEIDAGSICASPNLKFLTLRNTNGGVSLTKSAFQNCHMVTEFTFVYNDHVNIEEEVFSGLVNAKVVFLNSLKIETLTKGYLSGIANVEHLRIEDSSFTKINRDAFEGFTHLKSLTLTGTGVSTVEDGTFSGLSSLETLDISMNKLSDLVNITSPKLDTLRANSNEISKIDAKMVKENLPNLEYLIVIRNNISHKYESQLREDLQGIFFLANEDTFPYYDFQ